MQRSLWIMEWIIVILIHNGPWSTGSWSTYKSGVPISNSIDVNVTLRDDCERLSTRVVSGTFFFQGVDVKNGFVNLFHRAGLAARDFPNF